MPQRKVTFSQQNVAREEWKQKSDQEKYGPCLNVWPIHYFISVGQLIFDRNN